MDVNLNFAIKFFGSRIQFSAKTKLEEKTIQNQLIFSGQSLGSYDLWEKLTEIEKKESTTSIDISNNPIGDDAASDLEDFENIETLNIGNTLFTKLDFLATFSKLKVLVAKDLTNLINISVLENLPNLEEIYLSGTKVSDLSPLAKLKKLKILDLSDTPVDNLEPLQNLSSLTELYLNSTQIVSEQQLMPINHLKLKILGVDEHLDTNFRPVFSSHSKKNISPSFESDNNIGETKTPQNLNKTFY